ncbi:hypothetical protein CFP56_043945 [Quercus suber]|uniref:Uncharacterized protein n=1 Tax=Quercus suber TaxID=58331 RepID=A0AAW0IQD3_QUESU
MAPYPSNFLAFL